MTDKTFRATPPAPSTESGDVPAWARRRPSASGAEGAYRYTALAVPLAVDVRGGELLALGTSLPDDGPFPRYDAWLEGDVRREADDDARETAWRELEAALRPPPSIPFEALDTYDERGRDPRQSSGYESNGSWETTGARVITKAFLALVRQGVGEQRVPPGARWSGVYEYLPWEDLRDPKRITTVVTLLSLIRRLWVERATGDERVRRRTSATRAFGARLSDWNEERAGERFRVLLEAGLLEESARDIWGRPLRERDARGPYAGEAMAFDHRLMLADALGRLRGKLKYLPALWPALLGEALTLPECQRGWETIAGRLLHTANFRRVITQSTPLMRKLARRAAARGPGPRAALYAFRRDIERLRLDPALRMPWLRLPPGALV